MGVGKVTGEKGKGKREKERGNSSDTGRNAEKSEKKQIGGRGTDEGTTIPREVRTLSVLTLQVKARCYYCCCLRVDNHCKGDPRGCSGGSSKVEKTRPSVVRGRV